MNRLTVIVTVALLAAIAAVLGLQKLKSPSTASAPAAPSASVSSSASPASSSPAVASASASASASAEENAAPPASDAKGQGGSAPKVEPTVAADAGDGPKSIRFGIILVHYAGAQGVSPKARSKEEAARLAASLAEKGREDFAEAVKEGDEGSAKKAGKMYRGILEPSVEQAVFKLGKGEVSEPIDTPRGFWVVKRLK